MRPRLSNLCRPMQGVLILISILLGGCASQSFVYQGSVTKIQMVSIAGVPAAGYKIETNVEEILQGAYTKKECTLHMTDPFRSGIKEGGSYLFHVKREGLRYIPDEFRLKQQLYQ